MYPEKPGLKGVNRGPGPVEVNSRCPVVRYVAAPLRRFGLVRPLRLENPFELVRHTGPREFEAGSSVVNKSWPSNLSHFGVSFKRVRRGGRGES